MLKHLQVNNSLFRKLIGIFIGIIFILAAAVNLSAQDLPKKIRGYKVHRADVVLRNKTKNAITENDLRVDFDFAEPELSSVSLSGITISLDGAVTIFGQSGTVDFITFENITVNQIPIAIAEYRDSFDFAKGETVTLKKPFEIFVKTSQTLRGILAEKRESQEKWQVMGRVFVFGQFRKFGFRFKRVIPVEVALEIENPIRQKIGASN